MEQNPAALTAIRALRDLGGDAGGVLEGFATAKRMLEGRFKQYSPGEIPHWIGEMGTWHRPLHEPTTLSGTCCLLLKPVGDAKARSEASSDTRCYTF